MILEEGGRGLKEMKSWRKEVGINVIQEKGAGINVIQEEGRWNKCDPRGRTLE